MAVDTTFLTLTCPHVAAHTTTHHDPEHAQLQLSAINLPIEQPKTMAIHSSTPNQTTEDIASSPTSSEPCTPLPRRSSEAEIEARLARIPGHVEHCDTSAYALDPERLTRLRKAQAEAMEELKESVVFRPSSEMAMALAEIERRKMWEDIKAWE
jgi:hypothetical protein